MMNNITELELISIPLPEETETYIPVSNQLLLNKIRQIAGDNGYYPAKQVFNIAKGGNVMTGVINFAGYDNSMNMSLGFRNSYDKSKSLGIGVGTSIIVCTNGMFRADIIEMRKHTGNILNELESIIENQVMQMRQEYEELIDFKNRAQLAKVNNIVASHILGEMFFEEELINSTQLNIIKREIKSSTFGVFNEKISLWQVYNWVTESYKTEHPSSFLDKHVEFHNYFESKLMEV